MPCTGPAGGSLASLCHVAPRRGPLPLCIAVPGCSGLRTADNDPRSATAALMRSVQDTPYRRRTAPPGSHSPLPSPHGRWHRCDGPETALPTESGPGPGSWAVCAQVSPGLPSPGGIAGRRDLQGDNANAPAKATARCIHSSGPETCGSTMASTDRGTRALPHPPLTPPGASQPPPPLSISTAAEVCWSNSLGASKRNPEGPP